MTEKSTLQVLVEARELIADPGRWTQGALGRNCMGRYTSPIKPEAVQFCARGALHRAGGMFDFDLHHESGIRALQRLVDAPPSYSDPVHKHVMVCTVVHLNNNRSHPEVLALFDRAIAAERAALAASAPVNPQVQSIINDALTAAAESRASEVVA